MGPLEPPLTCIPQVEPNHRLSVVFGWALCAGAVRLADTDIFDLSASPPAVKGIALPAVDRHRRDSPCVVSDEDISADDEEMMEV